MGSSRVRRKMQDREAYQYAIWRVVPSLERGEYINAGVVLFCRRKSFLKARIHLDEKRLASLAPAFDSSMVLSHLKIREAIASGEASGGPVSSLAMSDRFGWLAAPSSTVIQSSEVHTGICDHPEKALDHLFQTLVLSDGSG